MKNFLFICVLAHLYLTFRTTNCYTKTVKSGETWTVNETTFLDGLIIENGGSVVANDGYNITLVLDGVETGQQLISTKGVNTIIQNGSYIGNVVVVITYLNQLVYNNMTFNFRQALSIDAKGILENESVFSSIQGGTYTNDSARDLTISSNGECFNGIFIENKPYSIENSKINLRGNGRCDFIGYGSAIKANGFNSNVVIDGVEIINKGVVRTAVVSDGGANMVIKNSYIQTYDGELPSNFFPTVDTTQMRSAPWMLGISGTVRATLLLGTNSKASYINSYIGSEGWGVLSTDGCQNPTLTAINSVIVITGQDGYGTYGLGNGIEYLLGCTFDVGTYASISRDSTIYFGDSDPEWVFYLNKEIKMGLTIEELRNLPKKHTIVNSKRFGIMFQGGGNIFINGSTIFKTKETTFLNKGQQIFVSVNGNEGAQIISESGTIFQLMDNDDPGETVPIMINNNTYIQPKGEVIKQNDHDIFISSKSDSFVNFYNIEIIGNFYNGMRGDQLDSTSPGINPRNLVLNFDNTSISGVISASTALHLLDSINYTEYKYLGTVTNTPSEIINNGVLVSLKNGSKWIISGLCYLSSLYVEIGSSLQAKTGNILVKINGTKTNLEHNTTYIGNIVINITQNEDYISLWNENYAEFLKK